MLKSFVKLFPLRGLRSGDPTKKTVSQLGDLAVQVNALEPQFEALSNEAKFLTLPISNDRLAPSYS